MIRLNTFPKNKEHFSKLLELCEEIINVCEQLGVEPVLSAGLAVFAYTKDQEMEVNDIDLSCSESDFPKIREALEARGIKCKVTGWHVLQVRRNNLKVEFDSREYWMKDLSENYEVLKVGNLQLKVVSLDNLKELYRKGLENTRGKDDVTNKAKHRNINDKYRTLSSL